MGEYDVYEPHILIDEYSDTEIYYGTSINSGDINSPNWKIRRAQKSGTVWSFMYPNGNQTFEFIWSARLTYDYK